LFSLSWQCQMTCLSHWALFYIVLYFPTTYLLGPSIFISTLFSFTCNLCSSCFPLFLL
jgi:hypothetical protein